MSETPIPGDRIELLAMPGDPCPIEAGATGTVKRVHDLRYMGTQISVEWDNGRTLCLITPPDQFKIIERALD